VTLHIHGSSAESSPVLLLHGARRTRNLAGPLGSCISSSKSYCSSLRLGDIRTIWRKSSNQLRHLLADVASRTGSASSAWKLGLRIWPAWLGLLLSVGSSMLAFPFFTYVPSDGTWGQRLPEVGCSFSQARNGSNIGLATAGRSAGSLVSHLQLHTLFLYMFDSTFGCCMTRACVRGDSCGVVDHNWQV
jgi:hypothetical protein